MKKITTYIVSIAIILLILASSSGISFVIHHCYTSKTEHVKLFADNYKCKTETEAEAEQAKPSCCCSRHHESIEDHSLNHINKSDCCTNTYKFLKFTYQYENGISAFKLIISQIPVIFSFSALLNTAPKIQENTYLYRPPPLIMAGKYLIHFVHNIKIPFPAHF
ncbi:MAG: hypothetical protein NTZ33_06730 [Bacteroidetes bacterium]|nr:hypothetical protein [Bacteroidota bacterium]